MAHESTIFHLPDFYVHIITNVPVGENIGALAGYPLFEIKKDFFDLCYHAVVWSLFRVHAIIITHQADWQSVLPWCDAFLFE